MQRRINFNRLYILCFILFFIICLPVWVVKAYSFSEEQPSNPYKLPDEQPALKKDFPISLYNTKTKKNETIDLEDYLIGVVAAEMPASFELEALKAQAVAARTYTIKKTQLFNGGGCSRGGDICTDSTHCQAYATLSQRKKNWGNNFSLYESKVKEAVSQTLGEAVMYENQPIEAFFHSSAGGKTENSENAFSEPLPYLISVDSDEKDSPKSIETIKISRKSFIKTLNEEFGAKLKNSILENNIDILNRFSSGRVDKIQIGAKEVTGKQIRSALALNSTNFSFKYDKNNVIITTKGFGHGVGMSQNGANIMAKEGNDYKDILQHYYTSTQILNIW